MIIPDYPICHVDWLLSDHPGRVRRALLLNQPMPTHRWTIDGAYDRIAWEWP
jgi:hypothetical protein